MARARVPQFGKWETEKNNNIQYTVCFENARIGKVGGKMINPNDPEQNPDMFQIETPKLKSQAPTLQTKVEPAEGRQGGRGAPSSRPRHENKYDTDSPSRYDSTGRRTTANTYMHHQRNDGVSSVEQVAKRSYRQPLTPDRVAIENSPLHPYSHARVAGGRVSLPSSSSLDKKQSESNHGLAPNSSRSRHPRTRSHEKAVVVPRFGDWDETNPASADGYTGIFNQMKEKKHNGGEPLNITQESTPNRQSKPLRTRQSTNACCFL